MERLTSIKNDAVKAMRALQQKKHRQQQGLFLIEGETMLLEALSCGMKIETLMMDEDLHLSEEIEEELLEQGCKCYLVTRQILSAVTETVSPQGMAAACRMRLCGELPRRSCLLLDSLQDPGNMGTIIRTADAMGIDTLIAVNCVDLYNAKVIRSTMGSLFRQNIIRCDGYDMVHQLKESGFRILASVLDDTAKPLQQCDLGGKICAVIGNEANGISQELRGLCDTSVYIPMKGWAESLNAGIAAGIWMWELSKSAEVCDG